MRPPARLGYRSGLRPEPPACARRCQQPAVGLRPDRPPRPRSDPTRVAAARRVRAFARRPGLGPDHVYKNRDRLQNGDVFGKFMSKLLNHPQVKPLLSDEHFSVDGTLIEAWASQKSFRPKDGSGDGDGGADFHGQKRKNDTHASTTDPDSRLYRKAAGREAKLSYMGHATMENRHGLAVAGMVTHANGTASAAPRRSCSRPGAKPPATASPPARTRPMTRRSCGQSSRQQHHAACDAER